MQLPGGEVRVCGALHGALQGGVGGVLERQEDLHPRGEELAGFGGGEVLVDVLVAGFAVPPDVASDGGDAGGFEDSHGRPERAVVDDHGAIPFVSGSKPTQVQPGANLAITSCSRHTSR